MPRLRDRTQPRRTKDMGNMNDKWRDDALCAQVGGDLWFPEKGGSVMDARKICAQCPVAEQCLQYALDTNQRDGIYGGTTPMQRRALRRAAA